MTVHEYLRQDRQWPRHCRIGHALLMMSKAKTPQDKAFWQAVLDANR